MDNKELNFLKVLAFVEGMSVMAVELLGAKMASVYYGNSLYVWTSILSISVGGLAVGYFLGGRVSTKYPEKKTLFYIFTAAALCVLIMPSWSNLVLKMTMILGYQTGAVVSCMLFLFPIMVWHGMIPPTIIKLITQEVDNSGNNTGNIYTISTLGGVIMTLVAGFYIIPNFGLRAGTYALASVLMFIPFMYFLKERIIISVILVFATSIIISTGSSTTKQLRNSHVKVLYKTDGLLGQMLVADDLNTQKRSLLVNNISQTFMHVPSGRSQWRYVHRIALYTSIMPIGSEVLICGIGGGNVINEMRILGFNVDAVDLDKRMAYVAQKYFGMDGNINVFEDDARHYIRTCKKKYDIIILDMSAGENQPSNVYTTECFKELNSLLNEDGILFVHYQNALEGENAIAVKSLAKTIASSGLITKLINTDKFDVNGKKKQWDMTTELMLFASKKDIDLNQYTFDRRDPFADPFNFPRNGRVFIDGYDFSDGVLLTDDNPIMDVMHTSTLETTRGATLEELIPILIKEKIDIY